jgi:adenine-specific DNA methylase
VRCGSIVDDPLPAGSVALVMTDPPYFANVQYAQLADFHHVWLKRLDPSHPDSASTVTDGDAVGSNIVGMDEFARRLSAVYLAAGRALCDGGAFCFTYHHNDLAAYAPIVMACLDAGLAVRAGYACPTEVRASQHIHGRNASTVDAVFVLRKSAVTLAAPGEFGSAWIVRRERALRAAGVKLTDADRACLRHCAVALAAIAALRNNWDADAPDVQRYEAARVAIGLPARLPASL